MGKFIETLFNCIEETKYTPQIAEIRREMDKLHEHLEKNDLENLWDKNVMSLLDLTAREAFGNGFACAETLRDEVEQINLVNNLPAG